MEPILRTEHLTFTYPGEAQPTLGDLSLEIARGSFVAVLGHNGSGKSTLAKHVNAILLPTGGKVYVDGMDTADENNLLSVRATVGMVFQNPDNQIVANVVEDDVAFAPENLGVPPQEIRARVDAALKQVGMYDFRLHAPHLLSGGQKQRVAIAGVIAMQPKCIVLDEPTAMLDPAGRREVIDTATKLCREQGITVVLITHHMEECIGADRVIVLSNGAVVADGAPKQVFSQVELLKREGLTAPVTVLLVTHSMDDAARIADRLIVFHAGHVAFDGAPAEVFAHTQALLDIGLDVPQSARIAQALRDRGIPLPPSIYTLEQLTDALLAAGKEAGVC